MMTAADRVWPTKFSDDMGKTFLHKLRHDLINAVCPIVEIPKWIDEDIDEYGVTVPAAMRENLDMLGLYSHRLHRMIEDLLIYAHINQHPKTEPAALSDLLEQVRQRRLPGDFNVTVDIQVPFLPIPNADIETLLAALLSNACKHHDRPSGKIHVACKKIKSVVQLTVSDDGPGVDPKFLEHIFDPLTTLTSRDQVEGSGMGLAIVRRIATLNAGYVKAISKPGKRGTCIVVWFP